jgi:biopolymer transport protein ExbB
MMVLLLPLRGLAQAELEQAYQKEYAFLLSEKEALGKRLQELVNESSLRVQQRRQEIVSLQARLLELQSSGDSLEENLRISEQSQGAILDQEGAIGELLERALDTLQKHGVRLEVSAEQLQQPQVVELIFKKAVDLVERLSSLHSERGEFFLADGAVVSGEIYHFGAVAAFGRSENASGALMPAGGGKLRLSRYPEGFPVQDLLDEGTRLDRIRLFLFETLEKPAEERPVVTLWGHVASGGIIGWVIVGLGLLGLLLAGIRAALLLGAVARSGRLSDQVIQLVRQGKIIDAISLCSPRRGSAARVLRATLRNLDRERAHIEDIVSEAIMHELPTLERFGSTVMVVAAVAPLLGLLGTVTGMISTFDIITEFGNTNPKLLSGGIAVALVTTELGLVVAIPLLLLGNMLSSWADSIIHGLEQQALKLINVAFGERRDAAAASGATPEIAREARGLVGTEELGADTAAGV